MQYLLILAALVPLAIGFGDRTIVLRPSDIIILPGMMGDGIRQTKECLNGITLLLICFTGFARYRMRPFNSKFLALFVGWAYFVSFMSKYDFSFFFLYYLLLGTMAIYVLSSLKSPFKKTFLWGNINIKQFLIFVAVVGLINAIYTVLQTVCIEQFFVVRSADNSYRLGDGTLTHRMVGLMGNPSLLAIYLSMLLPIYLYLRKRWAYLTFALIVILIFMLNSTTAYASAFAGVLFYIFFTNKKFFYISLGVTIIFVFLAFRLMDATTKFDMFNSSGRYQIWKIGYEKWINKRAIEPLGAITGHGLHSWEYEIGEKSSDGYSKWKEAHNDWFQILYETGVIGFGLAIGFLYSLFRKFLSDIMPHKVAMMASLMSFGVSGLTLFPLYSSCMILYAVVFTGLIMKKEAQCAS